MQTHLERLWRQTPDGQRGPKPSLSLDRIVDAAVALADSNGLGAVSMRTLAKRVKIAPMALYRYVGDHRELVDLMLDRIYATMRRTSPSGRGWRARVTAVAHDNRALYRRHAWAAQIVTNRPPLGPGMMSKYEYELTAFDGAGLTDVERDAALTYVLGFVESCARVAATADRSRRDSQQTDRQWWNENGPLLARVLDPAQYPTASRVGTAAGTAHGTAYDADHAYTFGLERALAGLDGLVAKRRKRRREPV